MTECVECGDEADCYLSDLALGPIPHCHDCCPYSHPHADDSHPHKTYSDPSLRRWLRSLSKRFRNENDEYPWQVVRWDFALGLFVLPCFGVGLQEGEPLLGLVYGSAFVAFIAITAWAASI